MTHLHVFLETGFNFIIFFSWLKVTPGMLLGSNCIEEKNISVRELVEPQTRKKEGAQTHAFTSSEAAQSIPYPECPEGGHVLAP